MGQPIANEIRRLILRALEKGMTVKDVIDLFDVKKTMVYELILLQKETGSYVPRPNPCGRKPVLTEAQLQDIAQKVSLQPDITLQELIDEFNLPVCISALCRTVKYKLGFNFKKNSVRSRTKS